MLQDTVLAHLRRWQLVANVLVSLLRHLRLRLLAAARFVLGGKDVRFSSIEEASTGQFE